jgi:AraC family transcriptional regulator of adaptative response / DNA-3-methyladenine glycosylase II
VHEDFERCLRAVHAKDARFDGWFVTAVLTTRIYCRPSCPARPPYARNMTFYPTAAAAQQAGFRACKRCRPDASPGSPEWNLRTDVVGRAMRLIADGTVDREGVGGLASRLAYSTRQLERLLVAEVGAGPLALARAQRAQTARLLIETSALPFTQVAFAAGFSSIRQFNDTVREVFANTPTELRAGARRGDRTSPGSGTLTLRLPFRSPLCPDNLFGHLAATAVAGVEEVRDGAYRRTVRLPSGASIVSLTPTPDHVACQLSLEDVRDLPSAIARCCRLLDLDADPEAVVDFLGEDDSLGELVAKAPGRRIPRTVDEHELAIRMVLSQQVSTAAASTGAARIVERFGAPVSDPAGGLTHLFPSVDDLAAMDPSSLALPKARQRSVTALVEALAGGELELDPGTDWERARQQLAGIPGVGPWTIEMIAMRGMGDPDAFPAGDMGVRKAAQLLALLALPATPAALTEHSRRWRPWRSYAVQYLWATQDHRINHWPPGGQL